MNNQLLSIVILGGLWGLSACQKTEIISIVQQPMKQEQVKFVDNEKLGKGRIEWIDCFTTGRTRYSPSSSSNNDFIHRSTLLNPIKEVVGEGEGLLLIDVFSSDIQK